MGTSLYFYSMVKNQKAALCLCGHHTHGAAVEATFLELYGAVYQCIERVVLALCHVQAGIVTCATLAYDDVACDAFLTAPDFNTKSL